MITNHNFFLEILKAVCLSVDWVPKLIQKFFPTTEQKLVQHCETEIVADACNALYQPRSPWSCFMYSSLIQQNYKIFLQVKPVDKKFFEKEGWSLKVKISNNIEIWPL